MPSYVQIPNLPAAIALNGTEAFEAVQAGVSVQVTSSQLVALMGTSPVFTGTVTMPDGTRWDNSGLKIASSKQLWLGNAYAAGVVAG